MRVRNTRKKREYGMYRKDVHAFRKTCMSFFRNMYVFFCKPIGAFGKSFYGSERFTIRKIAGSLLRAGFFFACLFCLHYYYALWQGESGWFSPLAAGNPEINVPEEEFALPVHLPETSFSADTFPCRRQYCLACHEGIEPPRPLTSGMMRQIIAKGEAMGDPNGCVVCHGGRPAEKWNKYAAHSGAPENSPLETFTPVPGALAINEKTCGACHPDHTYNVRRSHMNTEAGKMKAILWSWGVGTESYDHLYGDSDTDDPDGLVPRWGSEIYKEYMQEMAALFPGQYPEHLQKLPEADLFLLDSLPQQAAFTYLRNCNACHVSSKGLQDRGHYRGTGCAACHTLYSNEGYYEGQDASVDPHAPGHALVHRMQGSRNSPVTVNGKRFSGIQLSTCAACHAAGRRIGHAYQGLMALDHSDNRRPFDAQGQPQQPNAGYVFKYIRDDVHHRVEKDGRTVTGLLCQDCHTTTAMHGNGNMGVTTLATVEIECTDCHGTPTQAPWELPVGYGEEFGRLALDPRPRGVASEPMEMTARFATVYPKRDGYVLSARGNALGNVVKDGNRVIVHSETGLDFEAPQLKRLETEGGWTHPVQARTAMVAVPQHIDRLECYACHATWAPQYYGYTYGIDYRLSSIDWLHASETIAPDGTTAGHRRQHPMQPGAPVWGDYSHVRWENPPLGINGEGRVSPLTGVIQTVATVIGPDGKPIVWNRVAQADAGYNAMELAPLNPHTTSKSARACADCHGNPQAIGYGTGGGVYDADPSVPRYADVITSDGQPVSRFTRPQIAPVPHLHGDFTQVLDSTGRQVQTVDSHWPDSRPLTSHQRELLGREGTCAACHQDIPAGSFPIKTLGKVAQITRISFASPDAHARLLRENNQGIAWVKILAIVGGVVGVALFLWWIIRRKKKGRFSPTPRSRRYALWK